MKTCTNKISFILIISLCLFSFTTKATADKDKWMIEDTVKIQGENVLSIINIFHQNLIYPYPKSWPINPIFRNQTSNHFIVEHIPKDQTLNTWKDMFTIQGFKDAVQANGMTAPKILNLLKQQLYLIAPEQLYYKEIFTGDINGTPGSIVLMGIKNLPTTLIPELPKGVGEIGLYLALQGKQDMYVIHRSWKSSPYTNEQLPMTEIELNKWIDLLKLISLSDIKAPKKSD